LSIISTDVPHVSSQQNPVVEEVVGPIDPGTLGGCVMMFPLEAL
jgi:hypothetical protein